MRAAPVVIKTAISCCSRAELNIVFLELLSSNNVLHWADEMCCMFVTVYDTARKDITSSLRSPRSHVGIRPWNLFFFFFSLKRAYITHDDVRLLICEIRKGKTWFCVYCCTVKRLLTLFSPSPFLLSCRQKRGSGSGGMEEKRKGRSWTGAAPLAVSVAMQSLFFSFQASNILPGCFKRFNL